MSDRALIVGLDPARLDTAPDGDEGAPPRESGPNAVTSTRVRDSMNAAVSRLAAAGIDAELFLLAGASENVVTELGDTVARFEPAAIMIGAGVRLEPSLSWFFEKMVNRIVRSAPGALLCFNETPEAMDTAILRVLRPGSDDTDVA